MTLGDAIARVRAITPNNYDDAQLTAWVSMLDGQVQVELLSVYDGEKDVKPYSETEDVEAELIVPFPYDDVYIKYLQAQIFWNDGEFERYNNAMAAYNALITSYADRVARIRTAKKKTKIKGAKAGRV